MPVRGNNARFESCQNTGQRAHRCRDSKNEHLGSSDVDTHHRRRRFIVADSNERTTDATFDETTTNQVNNH